MTRTRLQDLAAAVDHAAATGNPHGTTAAQVGAEPTGTAASAVAAHLVAVAHFSGDWTDLTGKPSSYPPSAHTHAVGDTTGLQPVLDAKADAVHSHAIAAVTGLQTALDAKAATTHTHSAAQVGADPAGAAAAAVASHLSAIAHFSGDWADLTGKPTSYPPTEHTHAPSSLAQEGATIGNAVVWNGTSWVPGTPTVPWAAISGSPTTLAGYGITNAVAKTGDTMTGPLAAPSLRSLSDAGFIGISGSTGYDATVARLEVIGKSHATLPNYLKSFASTHLWGAVSGAEWMRLQNGMLGIGRTPLFPAHIRTAADRCVGVINAGTSVGLYCHNDANSDLVPFSVQAGSIEFRIGAINALAARIDASASLIVGADPGGQEPLRVSGSIRAGQNLISKGLIVYSAATDALTGITSTSATRAGLWNSYYATNPIVEISANDATGGRSVLLYDWATDIITLGRGLRISGNVGFYGTTPAAKPTVSGAKASNAALTSLCTALAALGLITNATT